MKNGEPKVFEDEPDSNQICSRSLECLVALAIPVLYPGRLCSKKKLFENLLDVLVFSERTDTGFSKTSTRKSFNLKSDVTLVRKSTRVTDGDECRCRLHE